jgi:hypothetical protein
MAATTSTLLIWMSFSEVTFVVIDPLEFSVPELFSVWLKVKLDTIVVGGGLEKVESKSDDKMPF